MRTSLLLIAALAGGIALVVLGFITAGTSGPVSPTGVIAIRLIGTYRSTSPQSVSTVARRSSHAYEASMPG